MSQHTYRRCGCRDESGKQLGAQCPELKRNPKHGSWGYYLSHGTDPKTNRRRQFRKGGFATKRAAESEVAELKPSWTRPPIPSPPRSRWATTP